MPPILLIEDDEDDVEFIRRALSTRRIVNPLIVIPDAESAQDYLLDASRDNALPVVAIIDIFLPRALTGLDLLAWIRTQPSIGRLPSIILTVSTDRTHESRAVTEHGALVLRKPIAPEVAMDALLGLGLALVPASPPDSGMILTAARD